MVSKTDCSEGDKEANYTVCILFAYLHTGPLKSEVALLMNHAIVQELAITKVAAACRISTMVCMSRSGIAGPE